MMFFRHLTSALWIWTIDRVWSKQVAVAFDTKKISHTHTQRSVAKWSIRENKWSGLGIRHAR